MYTLKVSVKIRPKSNSIYRELYTKINTIGLKEVAVVTWFCRIKRDHRYIRVDC